MNEAADIREKTKDTQMTPDEAQLVLAWMEQEYGSLPKAPEDWDSKERFLQSLNDLDLTSTPGYPYMREAPTIGQWLGADGMGGFDSIQTERLWYDVQRVMAGTYEHQFRMFIKDEPHKVSKIKAGKWRLIACAALPVQIVWRMALKHQNDWLNDHPYTTPSAHGLVFCYGGWKRFLAHARTLGLNISRDLRAWDTTAPGLILFLVKEFRKRQGGPDSWYRVMDLLYDDAFLNSVLRFSNGIVLKQCFAGFMKSGLFVTISDNSLAMAAMHALACLRCGQKIGKCSCTGDDVVQNYISTAYIDALESLGCVVKEYTARLEFMGTIFEPNPVPMYLHKHIVNFWTTEEDVEQRLDSYLRLWCHSDQWYPFWQKCAELSGVTTRSRAYYKFWYDSPMAKILQLIS